jgi:hypothetical protein
VGVGTLHPPSLKECIMTLEFYDYKGEIAYREKKEDLTDHFNGTLEAMEIQKAGMLHANGMSQDRNLQWIGKIPLKIWMRGIAISPEYWTEDNNRRVKQWMNKYSKFRAGDARL